MRPILLEMNGFGCFREPTRLDFSDADFFALVGPTGSGKSTVIDAMTFALYGSVPRWANRNVVALALAPTVTRGTVKLVFEVEGQRYVAARELRRAGTQVHQRAASLERLADPEGLALPDDETVPMARDLRGVTEAVEKLLGLSYEDFCQCVMLPQGQFADFLHAKPTARQEILLRLLGAEHYRRMMEKANQRTTGAAQRADFLNDQLLGYADATEAAESAFRARESSLVQLAERVETMLPRIREAQQELSATESALGRLQAEQAALAVVRVPDGVGDLDARISASRVELARLRAAVQQAEGADATARAKLAAAPDRAVLELVRERRAERGREQARIPGLDADARRLATASRDVTTLAREAEKALDGLRERRDEASRAVSAATERVNRLANEHGRLTAVTVPEGVAALDERRASTVSAAAVAARELEQAERAESDARDALASAAPEAPLAQAARDLDDLRDVLIDVAAGRAAVGRARDEQEKVEAALARAVQARESRQHEVDAANRAHVVADLRPHLAVGESCPVCEQTVATLPSPVHAPELAAARDRLAEAERALTAAQRQERQAEGQASRAEAALGEKLARQSALLRSVAAMLRGPLSGVSLPAVRAVVTAGLPVTAADPPTLDAGLLTSARDEVSTLAGARAEAVRKNDAASTGAQAARRHERAALADLKRAEDDLTTALSALRAARDPLVELGAPRLDDLGIAAGWASLARWAAEQAAARATELAAARAEATAAGASHQAAATEFADAERDVARLRADESAATGREQEAAAELRQVAARVAELGELLRGAPSETEVREQLALWDRLKSAADTAEASLLEARDRRAAHERTLAGLEDDEAAERAALSAARDRVIALGAPAVDGLGLLAAWTALAGWAADLARQRDRDLQAASAAVDTARQNAAHLAGRLQADLAEAGIDLATDALAASAPPAVASAVSDARAATKRVAERRAEAAALSGQRQEAQEQQQVAAMVGNLLRAPNFPQWLVSEAADDLVETASQTLSLLSSGQYDLAYEEGDFYVIDHADADSRRSARTLSGGETFQASLALALALSSQITALATAGAARLDSIFLDEGFGTLDPETLEVVATTLETLAQGDRMVGVVTHVAALAERVPVRFRVARNSRSSTITREGLAAESAEEATA